MGFEGLHIFEQVLLILGVLLFICLLTVIVYSLRKAQSVTRTVPLFGISVAMIAFPAIEKIQFEQDKITIETRAALAIRDSGQQEFLPQLENDIQRLADTPNIADQTMLRLAYYHATIFPNTFDSFAHDNTSRFSDSFFQCISEINVRAALSGQSCAPENPRACEDAKLAPYLSSLELSLRGKVPWTQTVHGQALILITEFLGDDKSRRVMGDAYVATLPWIEHWLAC